jgi:hypothetical protein
MLQSHKLIAFADDIAVLTYGKTLSEACVCVRAHARVCVCVCERERESAHTWVQAPHTQIHTDKGWQFHVLT